MKKGRAVVGFGMLLGIAVGIGLYTFIYANGGSYLTNDPAACANCHVMQGHYDAWLKSSHRSVAVCNDCHTPHNFVGKYWTKIVNGMHHSTAFTTGRFHEPIRITARDLRVTEGTCRSCHHDIVQAIDHPRSENMSCVRCHAGVGHAIR